MITQSISGESSPLPLGGIGTPGRPDQATDKPGDAGAASFDDQLTGLVGDRPAKAVPPEPAAGDVAVLPDWQLPGWESLLGSPSETADEQLPPTGDDAEDEDELAGEVVVMAVLPAAIPVTPPVPGAGTQPTGEAEAAVTQSPAGIRPGYSAGGGTGVGDPTITGAQQETGAPDWASATTTEALSAEPEGRHTAELTEPPQPQTVIGQDAQAGALTGATAGASPFEAEGQPGAGIDAQAGQEADSQGVGAAEGSSASANAGGGPDLGADGSFGDQSAGSEAPPQAPAMTPAGRRFAARIEEFVRETEPKAASTGAVRFVATEGQTQAAARAAAPVPVAPPPPPAEPAAENIDRLVQSIHIQTRQGISEATLSLRPEHLGEVTITIKVDRGTVSATVNAEAGDVCEWLRGQEEAIRNSLSEQGLQLERFVVQRDRSKERREPSPQQQGRQRAPREQDTDTPRFEVAA